MVLALQDLTGEVAKKLLSPYDNSPYAKQQSLKVHFSLL